MPRRFVIVLLTSALAGFPVSCAKQKAEKPEKSAGAAPDPRLEPGPVRKPPDPRARPSEPEGHHHHGGGSPDAVKLPASGHLGAPFAVKKTSDLAKVMAKPKPFVGKKIRVSGKVVAQCIHRRGWFALAAGGKRPWLRVINAPRFFIHSTAKGMNAEAEGTLEFVDVPEKMARHLAERHGLFGGKPDAVKGPQKMPVLRATGAKFTK